VTDRSRRYGQNIDGAAHYQQKYQEEKQTKSLLIGILVGLVVGLIWEEIRR